MTLQSLNKISNLYYFRISFAQTKTAFGKEKVSKISIEVECQVGYVGRHIEEPAVFYVSGCPYFPNRKRKCDPLSQNTTARITTVAMVVWMTSFVWDAEVVEHLLLQFVLQSTVIGQFYSIQVFPSRIKDGELEMNISRPKLSIYLIF